MSDEIILAPVINLNGTAGGVLLEQQLLAIASLRSAISTLQAAAPNGRDWQTVRVAGIFQRVQDQHVSRLQRLESVMAELEEIAEDISDQITS